MPRPGDNSSRGNKRRSFKRGGGRHFSRVEVYNADGDVVNPWSKDAILNEDEKASDESSSAESESSSESSSDHGGPSSSSRPNYIHEEHLGPQLGGSASTRMKTRQERKEAAIRKAAQKRVEVGDLPPTSDSEDDEPDAATVATPRKGILKKTKTQRSGSSSPSSDDSGTDTSISKAARKNLTLSSPTPSSMTDKKTAMRENALREQKLKEHREMMERLAKVREERTRRQMYIEAEKEDAAERKKDKEAKTRKLLEKIEKNKMKAAGSGGGKKKKKGKK